jgi:hypothetical protein
MLYGCQNTEPQGHIFYRVASHPWGPWSDATTLFDPEKDGGICQFIHSTNASSCAAGTTNPSDPAGTDDGIVYAPYMIDAYTVGDPKKQTTSIYFAMSTWRPYQVVLMRADLVRNKTFGLSSEVFRPDRPPKSLAHP